MGADYGWTADDVAWEIDFSGNETGCLEDMICDPSGGSVLALRPGVSARTVIQSLDSERLHARARRADLVDGVGQRAVHPGCLPA